MIYFIEDTVTSAIKIGTAKKPEKRLRDLQTATPRLLSLIGAIPGTRKDEQQVQVMFSPYRLGGEWFRDDIFGAILELIFNHQASLRRAVKRQNAGLREIERGHHEFLTLTCQIPGWTAVHAHWSLAEFGDGDKGTRRGFVFHHILRPEMNAPEKPLRCMSKELEHVFLAEDGGAIPFRIIRYCAVQFGTGTASSLLELARMPRREFFQLQMALTTKSEYRIFAYCERDEAVAHNVSEIVIYPEQAERTNHDLLCSGSGH